MALGLQVADHGLDGGSASELSLDGAEDAALLSGDKDAARVGRVMPAVSFVGESAFDLAAGELLGLFDDGLERVPVIGVARQRLTVEHELATRRAGVGADDRSLDAELVRRSCLAFTDAFDLGGVEGIELPAALTLSLGTNLLGAPERSGKCRLEIFLAFDLAADVASEPAQPRAQETQLAMMPLELL